MELKDVFGEIEADGAHLVHGRLLEWALTPPLWHAEAVGGRPHHQARSRERSASRTDHREQASAARSAREKAAIVAETLAPGANRSEIVRRHGLNRGLRVTWRRPVRGARPGGLSGLAPNRASGTRWCGPSPPTATRGRTLTRVWRKT